MMGENYSEEREEEIFFDTNEDCCSSVDFGNSFCLDSRYELWIKSPESVSDRRSRFLKSMGLSLNGNTICQEESTDESLTNPQFCSDRLLDTGGAELRMSGAEDCLVKSESFTSFQSIESRESFEDEDNFVFRIRNLDDGTEFVVDEFDQDGMLRRLHEVGSNQSLSFDEFQRIIGSSPLIEKLLSTYVGGAREIIEMKKKVKRSWLKRLRMLSHSTQGDNSLKPYDYEKVNVGSKIQKVKVHSSKKQSKELSSLYAGQDFIAHKGSISAMKFSLDGQFLASGGEDGVIRVWKVILDDKLEQFNKSADDPSCLYFTMNHLSKVASLDSEKPKLDKTKKHISSDSTCVIFLHKVFKVDEKPLHEFSGHSGEVLDLSWSKNRFLLSSSIDYTVRLWQVGCDRCLRVFSHNNYVTCVDFNPVDDNYFISGSIDGKVRIWQVVGCQVVDYTIIREIITTVCYRPGGKGAIVGTMSGNCLFYDIIDNRLQLDCQVLLQGKKKLSGRRITGFEFSLTDPSKVIVTSADSVVRVLSGIDVIIKFRASSIGIAANQRLASFTSDGKHVISTSEDSNVYIWNYNSQEKNPRKKSIQSYESFVSHNASIAIPWHGIENEHRTFLSLTTLKFEEWDRNMLQSSPDCFSLTRGFLPDSLTRGSATWPEEKLPDSCPVSFSPTKCKSEFKFLRNAYNSRFSSPHLWGLVIVTAGWDGRIRTYLNYGLPLRI